MLNQLTPQDMAIVKFGMSCGSVCLGGVVPPKQTEILEALQPRYRAYL